MYYVAPQMLPVIVTVAQGRIGQVLHVHHVLLAAVFVLIHRIVLFAYQAII